MWGIIKLYCTFILYRIFGAETLVLNLLQKYYINGCILFLKDYYSVLTAAGIKSYSDKAESEILLKLVFFKNPHFLKPCRKFTVLSETVGTFQV